MSSMFKEDPVFKATPEAVGALVASIHKGTLALPDFQRSFVWEPRRTIELLKSIISRYPAGTLLTWEQSDTHFGYRKFEGVPQSDTKPRRLVLDGQQRLTSLYQALTGTGDYRFFMKAWPFIDRENRTLRPLEDVDLDNTLIAYDANRKSRHNPASEDWQIANGVFALADYEKLRPWFKKLARTVTPDRDEADQLEELLHQLRDTYLQPLESYAFPVVDLPEQTSLVAVCNIFETLNRSGKVLGPFELLTAKFYPQHVNMRELWDAARQEYPILSEFDIDPYSLLQSICLRVHNSAQRIDVLNKLSAEDIKDQWDVVVAAAADVMDMLKRECGVISIHWLPYGMLLVPMAGVFPEISHLRSSYRVTAKERLLQYYWCSIFSENYDQGANSQAGADFRLLRSWILDESAAAPEAVAEFDLTDSDILSARANRKALYRGFVSLLIQQGAKDFSSAQAISSTFASETKIDTMRVFPKAWLDKSGNNPESHGADLILNRVLVDQITKKDIRDRPISEHLQLLDASSQRKFIEVLDSQLIAAEDEESGLRSYNYALFLRERLSLLIEMIESATGQSIIYEPDSSEF
ncbi:GmrSD restriction endonuclease domain-containing protein [Nonomuraea sp. NPDC001699]